MEYQNTPDFAQEQDQLDPIKHLKKEYYIPFHNGNPTIYLCGNSLGLQPKNTADFINEELKSWQEYGVEGHFNGARPWADYHELFKAPLSKLVGAKQHEVVCMNNLTTNLHLLLASFYQPKGKRVKVLIEGGAFPSDHYAAESHMRMKGINPEEHMHVMKPGEGEIFTSEEIIQTIHELGDELALVFLPGIQYYTGQFLNIKTITAAAHEVGAFAGFDLAHAAGNVPVSLHDDEVDFAAWCSYKYLNSGPGGVSGVFIHEKHSNDPDFPRLTGWWGHDSKTRFQMTNEFVPNAGADGWMLSNVNIISSAAHLAALEVFDKTSMATLRTKSLKLTGYLEYLLTSNPDINSRIKIITPKNPEERGCQLSIYLDRNGKAVFDDLIAGGVILDWREPNVIRVAPTPMYNSFTDVYEFTQLLHKLLLKHG